MKIIVFLTASLLVYGCEHSEEIESTFENPRTINVFGMSRTNLNGVYVWNGSNMFTNQKYGINFRGVIHNK